jgi:hypothetical protein
MKSVGFDAKIGVFCMEIGVFCIEIDVFLCRNRCFLSESVLLTIFFFVPRTFFINFSSILCYFNKFDVILINFVSILFNLCHF